MFTGLIEEVGRVLSVRTRFDIVLLEVEAPVISPHLCFGESVAVCGACLTVTNRGTSRFTAEMMPETVRRTRLSEISVGERVNLERALSLQGRLDGHIVQGHVDSVGVVRRFEREGAAAHLWVDLDAEMLPEIVPKGSVAVDGVSLTVIDVDKGGFSVGLIPTTQAETTIGDLVPGKKVNIETDILAKYVRRMLGARQKGDGKRQEASSLTADRLRELGWLP
ncbi:MAG: riboflavin synthase [Synergistales bacterium]|nr:riboflavin synthase [Synergistales bacterium]